MRAYTIFSLMPKCCATSLVVINWVMGHTSLLLLFEDRLFRDGAEWMSIQL
jgi:hypothetical protein